jgi:hypothetical protein
VRRSSQLFRSPFRAVAGRVRRRARVPWPAGGFPDEFVVLEGQALRFGVGMAQVICELSPLPEKHAQPRATETGHAPPSLRLRT